MPSGRNNVLLVIHYHGDRGAVIVRTDHPVIRLGQKNRMLVETVLVRISRAIDGKHFPTGIRHVVFRIALDIDLMSESRNRRGCKTGKQ